MSCHVVVLMYLCRRSLLLLLSMQPSSVLVHIACTDMPFQLSRPRTRSNSKYYTHSIACLAAHRRPRRELSVLVNITATTVQILRCCCCCCYSIHDNFTKSMCALPWQRDQPITLHNYIIINQSRCSIHSFVSSSSCQRKTSVVCAVCRPPDIRNDLFSKSIGSQKHPKIQNKPPNLGLVFGNQSTTCPCLLLQHYIHSSVHTQCRTTSHLHLTVCATVAHIKKKYNQKSLQNPDKTSDLDTVFGI